MDVTVELTNLYNKCKFDNYMMAFAPVLTSLPGFLSFFTSLIEVIISDEEVQVYKGISAAVYVRNNAEAGKQFGLWFKHLWDIEMQDAEIQEDTQIIGLLSSGA